MVSSVFSSLDDVQQLGEVVALSMNTRYVEA
jgi:hypothetical protein